MILDHTVWSLTQHCPCLSSSDPSLWSKDKPPHLPQKHHKLLPQDKRGTRNSRYTHFQLHTFTVQCEVLASEGCCLSTDLAVGTPKWADQFHYLLLNNCGGISTVISCNARTPRLWPLAQSNTTQSVQPSKLKLGKELPSQGGFCFMGFWHG